MLDVIQHLLVREPFIIVMDCNSSASSDPAGYYNSDPALHQLQESETTTTRNLQAWGNDAIE